MIKSKSKAFSACPLTPLAMTILVASGQGASAQPVAQEPDPPPHEEPANGSEADDNFEFLGPDGKPLPQAIQAQLREQMRQQASGNTGDPGTVVVRGRTPRGSVPFRATPERSLSQLELNAYGASSLEELIEALGPVRGSPATRSQGSPVLLLNGKRVANPADVLAIPVEAIERLEVFPEHTAARYGLPTDRKVLNVVTLQTFRSIAAVATPKITTEAGGASQLGSVEFLRIDGDTRFGGSVRYLRSEKLLEADRMIVQPPGDASLGRFRSLLPRTEVVEVAGNIARTLGQDFSGSLSARYRDESTDSSVGSLGTSPLVATAANDQLDLAGNLSGQAGRAQVMMDVGYSETRVTSAISATPASITLDAVQAKRRSLLTEFRASGPMALLPNGALFGSIRVAAHRLELETHAVRDRAVTGSRRGRDSADLSASVDVPILSEESALGSLSVRADGKVTFMSGTDDTRRIAARMDWVPTQRLNLAVAVSREQRTPSLEELGAPVLVSPNVRILDFLTGQTVDVDYVTGGNEALSREDRQVSQASMSWAPFVLRGLTLNATVTSTRTIRPISPFPLLTDNSVAAFPGRFTRDADGRLRRIDIRPVNFLESRREELFWGLSFSRSLARGHHGEQELGRIVRSEEEARRAFPNSIILTVPADSGRALQAESLSSRAFLNIYHSWLLGDQVKLAPDTAPLDLLGGDAVDVFGGTRRHRIEVDAGLYHRGLGLRLEFDWYGEATLRGTASVGVRDLVFNDYATLGVSAFANLSDALGGAAPNRWITGTRLSMTVSNLFNQRPSVVASDGSTPLLYQQPLLDPRGRTLSLTLRKTF